MRMLERRENIIVIKTEAFADRIVKMHKYLLKKNCCSRELLSQVLRSGTSIGANTAEGQFAQSKADFFTKMTIALKEANETRFWLKRLYAGECLSEMEYESILTDVEEIISLLVKITETTKERYNKK